MSITITSKSMALRYLNKISKYDDIFFGFDYDCVNAFYHKYITKVVNKETFEFEKKDLEKVLDAMDGNLFNNQPPIDEGEDAMKDYNIMVAIIEYFKSLC